MSEQIVKLGEPPTLGAKRDAIHIAVIPQVATKRLKPGAKVAHGVVDPFREQDIPVGGTYWLILTPGTAANLRHDFDHPAFPWVDGGGTVKKLEEKIASLESELDDWGCRGC